MTRANFGCGRCCTCFLPCDRSASRLSQQMIRNWIQGIIPIAHQTEIVSQWNQTFFVCFDYLWDESNGSHPHLPEEKSALSLDMMLIVGLDLPSKFKNGVLLVEERYHRNIFLVCIIGVVDSRGKYCRILLLKYFVVKFLFQMILPGQGRVTFLLVV